MIGRPRRRWWFVAVVGVGCGILDGGLFYALTANVVASLIIGIATAAILVILAIGGARQSRAFRTTPEATAEAEAKRRRIEAAMKATRPE